MTLRAKRIAKKVDFVDDGLEIILNATDKLLLECTETKRGLQYAQMSSRVQEQIDCLFEKLSTQTKPLTGGWAIHIRTTLLSMGFNMMCMRLLSAQPAYPSIVNATEILNDFSVLMRGGENTEGADISKLLSQFVDTFIEEGNLERCRGMSDKELFELLELGDTKCASLYKDFMGKNGHRAYKEFDFSTLTWQDDPSFIIKSLALRLRQYNESEALKDRLARETRDQEQKVKVNEILNKVERGRALLVNYLLPRARNAVVRREHSKSFLIKMVDKYRQAFRELGGLLCLQGRLPSADLIFQLSIDELETVVKGERADLSRILYKARRRQQRVRVLNQIAFEKPVMNFAEMLHTVKRVTDPASFQVTDSADKCKDQLNVERNLVRGMTSCAGCVTGRACVVKNLEDMDQILPNDILITYSIDISWSVYFFTLSGIVTEVGGIVSHGAVVAREYGIPTLCTALNACSKFKTGQIVTLDANSGVCYLTTEANQTVTLIDK